MRRSDRGKPDHYTDKAKKSGYLARSVYKLEAIQERFGVISPGDAVLDVGAAPGSWTQRAIELVGASGSVTAVDLSPLEISASGDRLTTVQGDLFDGETQRILAEHAPYNVIISDAAPATTGNRTVDTSRSAALVELVVQLSGEWLTTGGNLVAKIFQGGDEQVILADLKTKFDSARAFKPKATRKKSFETYLLGLGRRAP